MSANKKVRAWVFTANVQNDTPAYVPIPESECKYCCFQQEIAPTTLQRHYQGYIYFRNAVRLATVKELLKRHFHVNCHLEPARGSPSDCIAYCSKEESSVPGTFTEIGRRPNSGQGQRTDLEEIANELRNGTSLAQIADAFPSDFIRYHKGFAELERVFTCTRRDPKVAPTVHWWFGPTGTGKSKRGFESFPEAYVKMTGNKWWDGYTGQKEVILDDYRPMMCPFNELLKLLDRYPMRVEAKGSSMEMSATTFLITTCARPEVLWASKTEENIAQLLRRITSILEFRSYGEEPIVLKSSEVVYVPLPPPPMATGFRPPREEDDA